MSVDRVETLVVSPDRFVSPEAVRVVLDDVVAAWKQECPAGDRCRMIGTNLVGERARAMKNVCQVACINCNNPTIPHEAARDVEAILNQNASRG